VGISLGRSFASSFSVTMSCTTGLLTQGNAFFTNCKGFFGAMLPCGTLLLSSSWRLSGSCWPVRWSRISSSWQPCCSNHVSTLWAKASRRVTSLVGVQAPLKLDGGQGGWRYPQGGCFDDNIIILDSHRQGSLMRWLPAIGMAFGRRELVGGFVLPRVLLIARAMWIRGWHR